VVVEKFDSARGMALSLSMIGAPAIGGALTPLVGATIDAEGWREGYRLLALLSGIGGVVALVLIGKSSTTRRSSTEQQSGTVARAQQRTFKQDFARIARNPAFPLMMAGMFFCNFPQVLVGSQIKLVVMESGAPSQLATYIVSLYASGVIVGRLASGVALDKISPHYVAIFALGLPAIGFVALASPYDGAWILAGSILLVGLAQGAEGDIGAYLTSRNFDLRQYSFVFAFISSAMFIASATGSVVLSMTLDLTGSFNMFLLLSATFTVVGAVAFFLTGWIRAPHPEVHEPAVAGKGPVPVIAGDEI